MNTQVDIPHIWHKRKDPYFPRYILPHPATKDNTRTTCISTQDTIREDTHEKKMFFSGQTTKKGGGTPEPLRKNDNFSTS